MIKQLSRNIFSCVFESCCQRDKLEINIESYEIQGAYKHIITFAFYSYSILPHALTVRKSYRNRTVRLCTFHKNPRQNKDPTDVRSEQNSQNIHRNASIYDFNVRVCSQIVLSTSLVHAKIMIWRHSHEKSRSRPIRRQHASIASMWCEQDAGEFTETRASMNFVCEYALK